MTAHDPKASMYAIVTTSTPMVAKPRSAMPTPSIGALLVAKGMKLGFSEEVATIAAMKLVADAAKAAAAREALANPAPKPIKPPRCTLFAVEHHEKRKALVMELLANGWMFWSDLRARAAFGRPTMQRVLSDLVKAGRISVTKRRGYKVVSLVTVAPPPAVPPPPWTANARKPCNIDGVDYESQEAARLKLKVGKATIRAWAKTGKSAPLLPHSVIRPKAPAPKPQRMRNPCNIDGVGYESLNDAAIKLNKSKSTVAEWAKVGSSPAARRAKRHAQKQTNPRNLSEQSVANVL
jgi:hypothetical protein